jgi:hypothetical protein
VASAQGGSAGNAEHQPMGIHHPAVFLLDALVARRDNDPALPVAARRLQGNKRLNCRIDDALFFPAWFNSRHRVAFAAIGQVSSAGVRRLNTVTCSPRRAT